MPQATQLRLTQLTGSFGTETGQINDQISALATGSQNLTGLDGVLSQVASAIKRIHGFDSFTQALPGVFGQNLVVTGALSLKNTGGTETVNLSNALGSISGSGNLLVGGKATLNGNVETTGSLVLKSFDAGTAPAVDAGGVKIYAVTGNLYFKNAVGTESEFVGNGSVPGSDTLVIFNDDGAFGTDAGFTYTKGTDTLVAVTGSFNHVVAPRISGSNGNLNLTLGASGLVTVAGNLEVDGNNILASDGATNITLTSSTLTAFAGDIQVNGNEIRSSTGAVAISLTGSQVSIQGDLFVRGTTTEVSSTVVVINDRVIQLGTGSTVAADTFERGVSFLYGDGVAVQNGFMGYERNSGYFAFADRSSEASADNFTITRTAPISASNGRLGLVNVGGSGAGVAAGSIGTESGNLNIGSSTNIIQNTANTFVVTGTVGQTPTLQLIDATIQVRDTDNSGQAINFTDGPGTTTKAKLSTTSGGTTALFLSGAAGVDLLAGNSLRFQTVHMTAAKDFTASANQVTTFNSLYGGSTALLGAINGLSARKCFKKVGSTAADFNGGTIMSASALVGGDGITQFGTLYTAFATVGNQAVRNDRVSVYYNGQLLLSSSYDAVNYDYAVDGAGDVTFSFTMSADDIVIAKVE